MRRHGFRTLVPLLVSLLGASACTGSDAAGDRAPGRISPSASASSSGAANARCSVLAAHRYGQAVSATHLGHAVRLVIHPARLRCGGPDDGAYEASPSVRAITVAAAARVTVLVSTSSGIGTRRITVAELPGWLRADRWGRIFQLIGRPNRVTGLKEMYHP